VGSDKLFEAHTHPKLNLLPDNPEPKTQKGAVKPGRFPSWLHRPLPKGSGMMKTSKILESGRLPTVCEEAKCPNLHECWSHQSATFLAMGKECTRNCGFCDIDFSKAPMPLSPDEPERIAKSVEELGLKHVVITMVARDDLELGGAGRVAEIIHTLKKRQPRVTIEVLTSDFEGNTQALDLIIEAAPEIFNHNIETVERLTPRVRHRATYQRSHEVLRYVKSKNKNIITKSGMMLGLGEQEHEVEKALQDLFSSGCKIVTLGQYLQANRKKLRVKKFITPDQFASFKAYGEELGLFVFAGPFVRSSYNAAKVFESLPRGEHAERPSTLSTPS
jgi:lipoyl synthase